MLRDLLLKKLAAAAVPANEREKVADTLLPDIEAEIALEVRRYLEAGNSKNRALSTTSSPEKGN